MKKEINQLDSNNEKFEINIIRGQKKFGNLIEVKYKQIEILLDFGRNFLDENPELSEEENLVVNKKYDAILISHYHEDHSGLLAYADKIKAKKIFMGDTCKKVMEYIAKAKKQPFPKNVKTFNSYEKFYIGDNKEICITPILCDHSAIDSYMFVLENDKNEKIMYTGDFRSTGRKDFKYFLSKLPTQIDTLICESTNLLKKDNGLIQTELELQEKAESIMKRYNRVLVLQPTTNIDRIVSFYKASVRTEKSIIFDTYQSNLMKCLPITIPNSATFKNVYEFNYKINEKILDIPNNLNTLAIDDISGRKAEGVINDFCSKSFFGLEKYTLFVRANKKFLGYLLKINQICKIFSTNTVLIYSMWEGYKEQDNMKDFLEQIKGMGIDICSLHISGHATKDAIKQIIRKTNPTKIEWVHKL